MKAILFYIVAMIWIMLMMFIASDCKGQSKWIEGSGGKIDMERYIGKKENRDVETFINIGKSKLFIIDHTNRTAKLISSHLDTTYFTITTKHDTAR